MESLSFLSSPSNGERPFEDGVGEAGEDVVSGVADDVIWAGSKNGHEEREREGEGRTHTHVSLSVALPPFARLEAASSVRAESSVYGTDTADDDVVSIGNESL